MKLITANEVLNLKGVPCPQNSAKALLKLASMDFNEILERNIRFFSFKGTQEIWGLR